MERRRTPTSVTGARPGRMTPLRRLLARATARYLTVFVIPDAEIIRNAGLDLSALDRLEIVATPRHANILLIVGPIPQGLARASAVAYAQMPRPRWILAVDTAQIDGLPAPDVAVQPDQASLRDGAARLRRMIADGAFGADVAEFALTAVRTRTLYVCPMHPQIIQDTPGSCPICGMDLVQQEIAEDVVPGELGQEHEHPPSSTTDAHEPTVDASSYACRMHPEIVRDEPGQCPICGMTLVPRADEASVSATTHGSHDDHEPATHVPKADLHDNHADPAVTAMRDAPQAAGEMRRPGGANGSAFEHGVQTPDGSGDEHHVLQSEDGHALNSPSGMADDANGHHEHGTHGREPAGAAEAGHAIDVGEPAGHQMDAAGELNAHAGHSMDESGAAMDHTSHMAGGFMSMVEITKDLPRSDDGLPMDWIDVPFGPLFPGLPGGLTLMLTLDGDTVATADIRQGATSHQLESALPGGLETLHERIAMLDRLAPNAYSALAWKAVASAGGVAADEAGERARVGALERARTLSHLGWLSAFGRLLGYRWFEEQAAELQLAVVNAADLSSLAPARDGVRRLVELVERTPMSHRRLSGVGVIPPDGYGDWLTGPVARAAGLEHDARVGDPAYGSFGFAPVTRSSSDALARLEVRLHEVIQSLDLLEKAVTWSLPTPSGSPNATEATAALEMPRGEASIHVVLDQGEVSAVDVSVPSSMHVDMLPVVAEGVELADSLVATASLDISPWELDR